MRPGPGGARSKEFAQTHSMTVGWRPPVDVLHAEGMQARQRVDATVALVPSCGHPNRMRRFHYGYFESVVSRGLSEAIVPKSITGGSL